MANEKTSSPKEKKPWNAKRILTCVGLGLDIVVTVFLLVLSIILLVEIPHRTQLASASGFMGMIYFFMDKSRNGPTVFLCAVVIPLFVLLVLNIILTVTYYQREATREKIAAEKAEEAAKKPSLDSLSKEQRDALLKQLLKETDEKDKGEKK